MRRIALVFFVFVLLPAAVDAQDFQVSLNAEKQNLEIAQQTLLKFVLQAPSSIDEIRIEFDNPALEVLKKEDARRSLSSSQDIWDIRYQIAFFQTGKIKVGPFRILFFQQGKLQREEVLSGLDFQIKSILTGKESFQESKPPLMFETSAARKKIILFRVASGFLVILTMILLFYFFKLLRKKKNLLTPEQRVWKNFYETYLAMQQSTVNYKALFFRLSLNFKDYLSLRYQLPCEHLTNRELLFFLNKIELPVQLRQFLADFLRCSEQVKYAPPGVSPREFKSVLAELPLAMKVVQNDLFSGKN